MYTVQQKCPSIDTTALTEKKPEYYHTNPVHGHRAGRNRRNK